MNRATPTVLMMLAAGACSAQVFNIPPDAFPTEAFFGANAGTTVNVESGGSIFADGMGTPFEFNGATVNVAAGGASGLVVVDNLINNVTFNINGGDLVRTRFIGTTGTSALNINSGSVERGLRLMGNTVGTMSGGTMGVVGGGQPAMHVQNTASFTLSGGTIDTFIILEDTATFTQTGGTIDGAIQMNNDVVAIISAGSSDQDGFMKDIGCVLNLSGGTIGSAFVVTKGVVHMSGGAMGSNSAIINGSGVDPIFNMSGGALGSLFRAFDGTFNVSGGLVGDEFRLGSPTGDGSGVTMNVVCKSATLDGVPLMLTPSPTTIGVRGGVVLTCVLLDDTVLSLDLNETFVPGEDHIRTAALLTVALAPPCDGDIADGFGTLGSDGVVDFGDFLALLALVGPCPGGTPGCDGDIADGFGTLGADGVVDFGDFLALLALVGPCP